MCLILASFFWSWPARSKKQWKKIMNVQMWPREYSIQYTSHTMRPKERKTQREGGGGWHSFICTHLANGKNVHFLLISNLSFWFISLPAFLYTHPLLHHLVHVGCRERVAHLTISVASSVRRFLCIRNAFTLILPSYTHHRRIQMYGKDMDKCNTHTRTHTHACLYPYLKL